MKMLNSFSKFQSGSIEDLSFITGGASTATSGGTRCYDSGRCFDYCSDCVDGDNITYCFDGEEVDCETYCD